MLAVALAIMGWLILRTESDVLYRLQELSLWLPSRYFFHISNFYPGGMLTWAAAFMTQFFFHPWLGVLLLIITWAAIMALLCWLFRLQGPWRVLTLLVPLALMACLVQTGYWIYYMKLQGHPWVPTLGVLFAVMAGCIYRLIPYRRLRLVWLAIYGILGYPAMGAWSILGIGLMMVPKKLRMDHIETAAVALGLVLIMIVPPIMVRQFYGQVQVDTAYLAAMPSFQYGQVDCGQYRWSYYALAFAFAIIAIVSRDQVAAKLKPTLAWPIVAILLVLGCIGVNLRWERDTNFRKEVVMTNAIHRLDWEEVLRTMLRQDMGEQMPPTRAMVMMKNLALFRLGRIGDEMFRYPEGAEQQHAPWTIRLTQVGGKMLYYHYGKEGFCYRWCMEDGVEFGWSVDVLKYMAKTSLITHDWKVAKKYIDMLSQTIYHRDWAKKYAAYVEHPELMAEDEEMKPIIPMAEFTDRLDGDNTLVELCLLKTFSSGHGADPGYQEMTLVCSLIMKDIELFWPRFRQYLDMHQHEPGFRVPRYYQEAAYLYSMLEPQRESALWPSLTNAEVLAKLPFDESVKQTYSNFMTFNAQCGSMTDEQKKVAFLPQYGDTFYYFYFLRRNQKTN